MSKLCKNKFYLMNQNYNNKKCYNNLYKHLKLINMITIILMMIILGKIVKLTISKVK